MSSFERSFARYCALPLICPQFFRGRERDFSNSENGHKILPDLIEGEWRKPDFRFLSPNFVVIAAGLAHDSKFKKGSRR